MDVLTKALNDLNSGRIEKAEKTVKRVLAKYPSSTDALQVKAMIHRSRGETADAIAVLERGLQMRPNAVGLATVYGSVLGEAGHYEEALSIFERIQAQAAQPPDGVAYNISLMLMTLGRFEDALPQFEARLSGPTFRHTVVNELPRWQGEDLAGKHILVTGEQGLGDQILFAGLVRHLVPRARRVTLTSNPRLMDLFARSFPDVTCISHSDHGPDLTQVNERPDLYCPAGSLALHLSPDLLRDRPHARYLSPDPDRVALIRERYRELANGRPIVGISWSSPRAYLSAAKSMPSRLFGQLFKGSDVFLVNLQYRPDPSDVQAITRSSGLDILQDPDVDPEQDMDGVAAQCLALDHVVSVSTSLVHLAGAVGAPTTVLLPKGVGVMWYWSTIGGLQPWYKSVETLSQTTEGSWTSVVDQFTKRRAHLL